MITYSKSAFLCPLCVKIFSFTNEAHESGAIYIAETLGSSRRLRGRFFIRGSIKRGLNWKENVRVETSELLP